MPSALQSRGFEVNVMPNVQLANPTLFDPYGGISRGLASGVSTGGQIQDIILRQQQAKAEAQLRPLREQLLTAQLQGAQQGNQFAAAEQPYRLDTLQRAKTLADVQLPRDVTLASQPIVKQVGSELGYSDFTDPENPSGDLVEYGFFEETDPVTGKVQSFSRPIRTVKTGPQIQEERLNAEAMRGYRSNLGQAAVNRAATAEQVAAFKRNNPTVKTKTFYDSDLNVFEQVINPDGSLGEVVQITLPNGQPAKKPQTEMGGLAGALTALSGANPSPAPVAAVPAGVNFDALGKMADSFAAPQGSVSRIETKAQYDALPVGAVYIDVITGTRHIKGK